MIDEGIIHVRVDKLSYFWSHAMLNLQRCMREIVANKTFKEGNIEVKFCGKVICVRFWAELFVISNQNQVLCTGIES